jgi:hypothetical protein
MSDYAIRSIDDMAAIHGGLVKLAGAELSIDAFGMQVLDLPAGFTDYPAHDHSADGQEEVYVLLRGSAELSIGGDRVSAVAGQIVRVAPEAVRALTPGPEGARILAIGCAAGRRYERPPDFQLQVTA